MIDGVKAVATLEDFEGWKQRTGLSFTVATDIDTGAIIGRKQNGLGDLVYTHKGRFEEYLLTVKEVQRYVNDSLVAKRYNLIIRGSLHKNHFRGRNYGQFRYSDLQYQIVKLSDALKIPPDYLMLQNLEVGLNVKVPFHASSFIARSLLLHKTSAFTEYEADRKGLVLGKYAKHAQYSVKCYDKGLQNDLNYPLMRFEVRFTKMKPLKEHGVASIADLTDAQKVYGLGKKLIEAWDNVLIAEPELNLIDPSITREERVLLELGQCRDFWQNLHRDKVSLFNNSRRLFKAMSRIHSLSDTHQLIRNLLVDEWKECNR